MDISAPGNDIYCIDIRIDGYAALDGTSFAASHVAGVAGMIFACNPTLTGDQVKNILASTANADAQRHLYYTEGDSGIVDAGLAVRTALLTNYLPPEKAISMDYGGELDLCFVIDTTGSMGDDIDDAKENMQAILSSFVAKTNHFRIAIVDYRDNPEKTEEPKDYTSKLQLDFSSDEAKISQVIQDLELGYGGDNAEAVYSGLMQAVRLEWRAFSEKVIVILGDAPPLDPEPDTGYTQATIFNALKEANIGLGADDKDFSRIFSGDSTDAITVFSIGTSASSDAAAFLEAIAEESSGSYRETEEAAEVSDAIIASVEEIEVHPTQTATVDFGPEFVNYTIELYKGSTFICAFPLDVLGARTLVNVEPDTYTWSISDASASGTIQVTLGNDQAELRVEKRPESAVFADTIAPASTLEAADTSAVFASSSSARVSGGFVAALTLLLIALGLLLAGICITGARLHKLKQHPYR
ncbi:MAG: VWA domain-containing protein [Coriobacteriales bacterium]|nr:VWA domain-containing protein [Coriobacteriales bacterium]